MISLARPATYAALATALLAVLSLAAPASAQRAQGPEEVPVAELMKPPGDLPEITLGPADAKVTIVEYASLSCGHCAAFHKNVLPELKTKYIDTGKIRLIMRDHPGNDRAVAGAMLVRCVPNDRAYPLITRAVQSAGPVGLREGKPAAEAAGYSKQAGFTEESFNKCLTDDKLLKTINSNFETRPARLRRQGHADVFREWQAHARARRRWNCFDKAIAEAEGKPNG